MVLYCNRYLPDCQGQKALISGTAPLFSVSSSCTDTCPGRKAPVRHRTDRSWPRSRPSAALPPPPAAAEAEAAAVIRHTAAKAVSLRFRRVKGHVDRRRLPLRLRVQHDGHAVFPPQTAAQLLPAEGIFNMRYRCRRASSVTVRTTSPERASAVISTRAPAGFSPRNRAALRTSPRRWPVGVTESLPGAALRQSLR